MPSSSKKQHNLMAAVANSPGFAKKVGIKQSVGKEFLAADKGKKFAKGGIMDKKELGEDKKLIKRAFKMHDDQSHEGKKTDLSKLKKGGVAKMARGGGVETKGKTKGKMVTMCGGGKAKK